MTERRLIITFDPRDVVSMEEGRITLKVDCYSNPHIPAYVASIVDGKTVSGKRLLITNKNIVKTGKELLK